jgi:hypothetical protein
MRIAAFFFRPLVQGPRYRRAGPPGSAQAALTRKIVKAFDVAASKTAGMTLFQ